MRRFAHSENPITINMSVTHKEHIQYPVDYTYNKSVKVIKSNPSQDSSIGSILAWNQGVPGSNPGKGENLSVKISNWIVRI